MSLRQRVGPSARWSAVVLPRPLACEAPDGFACRNRGVVPELWPVDILAQRARRGRRDSFLLGSEVVDAFPLWLPQLGSRLDAVRNNPLALAGMARGRAMTRDQLLEFVLARLDEPPATR